MSFGGLGSKTPLPASISSLKIVLEKNAQQFYCFFKYIQNIHVILQSFFNGCVFKQASRKVKKGLHRWHKSPTLYLHG